MKHNNEKQHINTVDTQQWKTTTVQKWKTRMKKQQSYNNHITIVQQWKTIEHKNEKTTIVQQSYNIRTAKKNNEKRKWNTNQTQQWKTTLKHSNDK